MKLLAQISRLYKAFHLQLGRLGLAYGVIALALLVVLLFSFVQRSEINTNFAYRGDSPSYLVSQLEREYLRLREVMRAGMLHPEEMDREAIVLRNDILNSRLELVTHSPVVDKISSHKDFIGTVAALSKFSDQMDSALSAPKLDSDALTGLLKTMGEVEAPLQALGLTATVTMARDS